MLRKLITAVLCAALAGTSAAADVLTIRITQGIEKALPIAVVPFGYTGAAGAPPVEPGAVIAADLARSGRFAPMPFEDLPSRPSDPGQVNFRDWSLIGMDNLVIGRVVPTAPGQYEIEFRLLNVYNGRLLAGYKIPASDRTMRLAAHQIADIIYEKLTGQKGAFATRVAYVTAEGKGDPKNRGRGRTYRLHLADADGHNARVMVESKEPLLSPAWSPDGRRIAYVSFEKGNSAIWVQDVETGRREQVSGGIGINSAPAWSPDGRRLALTLSKDGNAEIYVLDVGSRTLQRITNDPSIDTEAAWSPDGRRLAFTSDRAGGPQIYAVDMGDGTVKRLTFDKGNYNARPRWSPDGRKLAMVHGGAGGYRIAVLDLATDALQVLTDSRLDESPSFAPNGSMILYTTVGARGTELAAVSVDGRVRQRLTQSSGEVREPDWGPVLR